MCGEDELERQTFPDIDDMVPAMALVAQCGQHFGNRAAHMGGAYGTGHGFSKGVGGMLFDDIEELKGKRKQGDGLCLVRDREIFNILWGAYNRENVLKSGFSEFDQRLAEPLHHQ